MMAEVLEEASKHAAVETTATAKATFFGIKILGALQGLFAFLTWILAVWTFAYRNKVNQPTKAIIDKESEKKSVRAQLARCDVRVLEIEVNDLLRAGEIKEQNETIKSLQETIETLQQRLKSSPGWAPGGSGDGSTASARARGGRAPSSRRQPGGQGETRPL